MEESVNLIGKVCIVTGGARGIGRAIVEAFSAAGAEAVFVFDVSESMLAEIAAVRGVQTMAVDVTREEQVAAAVEQIRGRYGRVDVVVNNAGITRDALIQKMSGEDWDAVMAVNLKGPFILTRAVAPIMMENGSGSIVSIASVVGIDGNIGQSNYAATKAGIIALTKTWAKEFARKGAKVRANAVAPGYINTPMVRSVPEKVIETIVGKTVLRRLGEPSEVANAVLFLACEDSSFITGQVLRVDGGLVL